MSWPSADYEVSEDVVRALLMEQCPDLVERERVYSGEGFDNTLWRLGDDLVARFPRRQSAVALMDHEIRWLPLLAPDLPLPVPVALRVGRPGGRYPSSWVITSWFRGDSADRASLEHPGEAGEVLGRFLRALHRPAPEAAPHNPWRSGPVTTRRGAFNERARALSGEFDEGALRRVWERALVAEPWTGPPVWIHGDLHPANLLIRTGELAAVLDFGDLAGGDPAVDVAGAWMLLDADSIDRFLAVYRGHDAAMMARARGWAALFALFFIELGLQGRPSYLATGRVTVARLANTM